MKILLPLILLMAPVPAQDPDVLVIRAERIITVSGDDIVNGVIVIENGKIKAIGKNISVPDGAKFLKAKVVMPGLVDAGIQPGISGRSNEDAKEVTPTFRVVSAINPKSADLRRIIQNGVTTIYVGPGNRNVIGGLGSVIRTVKTTTSSLVLREDVSLKATMGSAPSSGNRAPRGGAARFYSRRPTTRMGVVWLFRKAFFDAAKAKEEGNGRIDPETKILIQALEKKLPVRIWASRGPDIETALRLCKEFGLSPIIEEADEAWKVVELLKKGNVPVILRPKFSTSSPFGSEGSEVRLNNFALLCKSGVKVAISPPVLDPQVSFLATVAFTVRCGADPKDAIRSVTLTPAEILGVARRVGSLEKGKDANLILLSGNPLDVKTRIEAVLLEGKIVYKIAEK